LEESDLLDFLLTIFVRFSLREFENLQSECQQISQLYQNVNQLVVEQAPMVEAIAENVEETEIHVEEGTRQLQIALGYKKTIYPILGGFIGACMLGPVGLVAGLKAGSAATVCGGICGYAGGKFLKKANSPEDEASSVKETPPETTQIVDEAIK
jgi:syntaxin 17